MARTEREKSKQKSQAGRPEDPVIYDISPLTDDDIYLFNEGSHFRLYEKLGAHPMTAAGKDGTYFAVWAPDAKLVFVMGDFNGWKKTTHPLRPRDNSGIWEGFIRDVTKDARYKYYIVSRYNGYRVDKTDPFSFYYEVSPLMPLYPSMKFT